MSIPLRQLNWRRRWSKARRYLYHKPVEQALRFGLELQEEARDAWLAPFDVGRGPLNGVRTPQVDSLGWYRPFGRCHHIAPFAWALAKELYPAFRWVILTSGTHSVAYAPDAGLVGDILLFDTLSAEESLAFVRKTPAEECGSLAAFAAVNRPVVY